MTAETLLFSTLTKVCEGTFGAYPDGHPLPFFVYKREPGGEFYAGGKNYALLPRYRVELLLKERDPQLVADFEAALSSIGTWRLYDADWLDSEGCIDHDYRLSLDISLLKKGASDG